MYANTCWGLLGLAVTFGLAVLGLPTQYEWLSPWFLGAAVACGVGSVICFGWPLRHRDNRAKVAAVVTHPVRAIKLIEPLHIIILGLAIALSGVIWQSRRSAPADELTIVGLKSQLEAANKKLASAPPVASSQQSPQQAAPVQNSGPEVPKDQLQLTRRLIQLTGLIQQAKDVREAARASGTAAYGRVLQNVVNDPNYRKPPLGLIGHWPTALRQLRTINALFDPNRKMDLETYPELGDYSYKPPQESAFGNDGGSLSQYRSYYYLTQHVGKQADALIAQMEEEARTLRARITNTAALSALEDSK
jgi:hypothetical protein